MGTGRIGVNAASKERGIDYSGSSVPNRWLMSGSIG
jgi:hypothetical protein